MADVSNELIYEVLEAMQTDIANLYNSVDALGVRVARIEQRLELTDTPVV